MAPAAALAEPCGHVGVVGAYSCERATTDAAAGHAKPTAAPVTAATAMHTPLHTPPPPPNPHPHPTHTSRLPTCAVILEYPVGEDPKELHGQVDGPAPLAAGAAGAAWQAGGGLGAGHGQPLLRGEAAPGPANRGDPARSACFTNSSVQGSQAPRHHPIREHLQGGQACGALTWAPPRPWPWGTAC